MESKDLYVVLVSMGRTSVFLMNYFKLKHNLKPMAHYLSKGKPAFYSYHNDEGMNVIFLTMNTGKERKESFDFMSKAENEFGVNSVWLESVVNKVKGKVTTFKIVDRLSVDMSGTPFEDMLKKYGLPNNRGVSTCTRELKQRPKEQFLKRFFLGYNLIDVVGIRADEAHRKSIHAGNNIIYPLCDEFPVDSKIIRSWWDRQSFDLQLKDYEGNCDLCFKKSLKKRLTITKENKGVEKWWDDMENKYKSEVSPRFDLRTNMTIADLFLASLDDFILQKDSHLLNKEQLDLFEFETDCFCKAT